MVREIDDNYVSKLYNTFADNGATFLGSIICIADGITHISDFDKNKIQNYSYSTIGGNHRRVALQKLLSNNKIKSCSIPSQICFGMLL